MILSAIFVSCLLATNCFGAVLKNHHRRSASSKQKAHRITDTQVIQTGVDERDVVLTPEDYANVDSFREIDLRTIGIDVPNDPLLKAGKFEGDIANLSSRSIHKYINDSNSFGRAAIRDQWRRWPNGQIPYVLSSQYGSYSKQVIAKAFEEYRKKTCIRFIPRDESKHQDYIYINPDDGCYSLVGRTGGRQPVSLDSGCIQVGTVIHELMHSTGFFHEQSRADRDDFVEIVFGNVQNDAYDQFEKYSLRTITHLDLPYDYGSIMHYGPYAFSKNGQKTIKALKDGGSKMGQRDGFSSLDLQKLNKLYQCEAVGGGSGGDGTDVEVPTDPPVRTRRPSGPVTRPPPPSSVPCENSKWQCFFWSKLNYCQSSREYMVQYCPKSCNFCDEITGSNNREATRGPSPPSSSSCQDTNDHCSQWSNGGYCNRDGFEDFMRQTCPQACGACSGSGSGSAPEAPPEQDVNRQSTANCQDDSAFKTKCKTYAFWGFCTGSNEEFMRRKCRKSCNFC